MNIILLLGIAWTCYGVAGLLGYQNIRKKYAGYSWTRFYKRACGIAWLMESIPWIVLGILDTLYSFPFYIMVPTIILFAVPALLYSIRFTRKFDAKLAAEMNHKPDGKGEKPYAE